MTTPTTDRGRDGGNRTNPDAASKPDSFAPAADAAINLCAWLIGLALDVPRIDVAVIALVLAGWPR